LVVPSTLFLLHSFFFFSNQDYPKTHIRNKVCSSFVLHVAIFFPVHSLIPLLWFWFCCFCPFTIRHEMESFVSKLESHCFVEILEVSWPNFVSKVAKCSSIRDLSKAHWDCIRNIKRKYALLLFSKLSPFSRFPPSLFFSFSFQVFHFVESVGIFSQRSSASVGVLSYSSCFFISPHTSSSEFTGEGTIGLQETS
jgi:hypothetical protein